MNFRFTLVLLVVAIVAVGAFALAQRQVPPSSPSAQPQASATATIIDLTATSLSSLDIKTGDKETLFEKNGTAWKLSKPANDTNIDGSKVNSVVAQVAPLSSARSVAKPGEDIGPYGLRNPQLTVTLSGGGKNETLLIGDKNVNGNQYFAVRQEGSDVGLIPSGVVTALQDLANNPPKAAPTPVPSGPSSSPSA